MARPINPYGVLLAVFLIALRIRVALTARLEVLSQLRRVSAGTPTAARPPGTSLINAAAPISVFGRSFLAAYCWLILLSAVT
jgi:hypothetical protein